jgi:hypothetical protein
MKPKLACNMPTKRNRPLKAKFCDITLRILGQVAAVLGLKAQCDNAQVLAKALAQARTHQTIACDLGNSRLTGEQKKKATSANNLPSITICKVRF